MKFWKIKRMSEDRQEEFIAIFRKGQRVEKPVMKIEEWPGR